MKPYYSLTIIIQLLHDLSTEQSQDYLGEVTVHYFHC